MLLYINYHFPLSGTMIWLVLQIMFSVWLTMFNDLFWSWSWPTLVLGIMSSDPLWWTIRLVYDWTLTVFCSFQKFFKFSYFSWSTFCFSRALENPPLFFFFFILKNFFPLPIVHSNVLVSMRKPGHLLLLIHCFVEIFPKLTWIMPFYRLRLTILNSSLYLLLVNIISE